LIKNNYEYDIVGKIVNIYLYFEGEKYIVIVDKVNLDKFLNYKYRWYLCWHEDVDDFYVRATQYSPGENPKPILLHEFLLGFPKIGHTDHINHKTLDNRVKNLRVISVRDNLRNRKTKNSNNKSGYRNVCLVDNKWLVQLQVDGKNKRLKSFPIDQLEEAGKYAEEMRKLYYGDFAGGS
jgi:hypothetical protein